MNRNLQIFADNVTAVYQARLAIDKAKGVPRNPTFCGEPILRDNQGSDGFFIIFGKHKINNGYHSVCIPVTDRKDPEFDRTRQPWTYQGRILLSWDDINLPNSSL